MFPSDETPHSFSIVEQGQTAVFEQDARSPGAIVVRSRDFGPSGCYRIRNPALAITAREHVWRQAEPEVDVSCLYRPHVFWRLHPRPESAVFVRTIVQMFGVPTGPALLCVETALEQKGCMLDHSGCDARAG
jgi:hypothetical protein